MKKKLIMFTVSVIFLLGITACGKVGDDTVLTEQDGLESKAESTNEADVVINAQQKENETDMYPTIEETLLWDENGVRIIAKELTYTKQSEDLVYANLVFSLENNNDKEVNIAAGSHLYDCKAINGYMINQGTMNEKLGVGESSTGSIEFLLGGDGEIGICGIKEIAEMQIGFSINLGGEEVIFTGPCVIKTSIAESYDASENTYQKKLTDEKFNEKTMITREGFKEERTTVIEGVEVISCGVVNKVIGGREALLEVKNNTDKELYCAVDSVAINDIVVAQMPGRELIAPGCCRVISVNLDYYVEEAYQTVFGINSLDKMEFDFSVVERDEITVLAEQDICFNFSDNVSPFDTTGTEVYNQDAIRIVSKGLYEDSAEECENYLWIWLVESDSVVPIELDDSWSSCTVNGIAMEFLEYELENTILKQGKKTAVAVKLDKEVLASRGVNGIQDIEEISIDIELKKDWEHKTKATLKWNK